MKKKTLLFVGLSALSVCAMTIVALPKALALQHTQAEALTYTFSATTSSDVTAAEATAGEFTRNTSEGNPITFSGTNLLGGKEDSNSDWVRFTSGGYIQNETAFTGIKKITIKQSTQAGASLKVTYGMSKDAMSYYKGWKNPALSGWNSDDIVIDCEVPAKYFKIETKDGVQIHLKGIQIEYTCEETPERDLVDMQSNDLLYSAWREDLRGGDHVTITEHSTVSYNGGYSWEIKGTAEQGGWPDYLVQFDESHDVTNAGIKLMGKLQNAHTFCSFKLYDSNWADLMTGDVGGDFGAADENGWREITIKPADIEAKLMAGKNLTDVKFVRICHDFDKYSGVEQTIWLDEFHFYDALTDYTNWEQMYLDYGQTAATGEYIDYKNTYGNSNSARTFTFKGYSAPAGQDTPSYMTWNPQDQKSFGADVIPMNTGTLSFDYKPSIDLIENANPNKHMCVLQFTEQGWSRNKSVWKDIVPSGASGFTIYATSNGWFHCSFDMATILGEMDPTYGNVIRIYFGVFGLINANLDTCSVTIDNMVYSPLA